MEEHKGFKRMLETIMLIILVVSIVSLTKYEKPKEKPLEEITGKVTATGLAKIRILPSCTITIDTFFTMISLCANITNTTINDIFGGIDFDFILRFNSTKQNYDIFSPEASDPPFQEFNLSETYVLYRANATKTSISLSAENASSTEDDFEDINITLPSLFVSPAYPYEFTSNVIDYLESINGSYSFMLKFNATSQKFMIFSPEASDPDFSTISRGEGQFIYITNSSGAKLKYNRSKLNK